MGSAHRRRPVTKEGAVTARAYQVTPWHSTGVRGRYSPTVRAATRYATTVAATADGRDQRNLATTATTTASMKGGNGREALAWKASAIVDQIRGAQAALGAPTSAEPPDGAGISTRVISSGDDTSTAAATSTSGPPPPAATYVPRNLSIGPQPRTSGPAPGLPSDCSNE